MSSFATIACCLCGTSIPPNEAAMCLVCLRGQIDVTDGIGRNGEVIQCNKCDRWFSQKDTWVFHELESPGLMALCLRKVTGMSKVKIIDAFWIWTEPHSKRLKVAMEIEKSVLSDKMALRQRVEIEYIIRNKQCLECIREASEHTWGSQIQLRQRVSTTASSSLITLESALIKAGMHNLMLSIEVVKQGMNLYFKNKNQAEKVVNFISNLLPTRVKSSKKMISANKQNNTEKYEYVYLVDVVPLVKHDLVYLTKDHKLTSSPQLMIVEKLSSSLHLMNPLTLQRIEMTAMKYFALPVPLTALMNSKQLVPYILLDLEPSAATAQRNGVETLSDVTIARESDLGENDITYQTTTHLGHLLKAGDAVLGYDVTHSTLFSELETENTGNRLPTDVVLVKKGRTPKFADDFKSCEAGEAGSLRDDLEEDEELEEATNLGDLIQTAQAERFYQKSSRGKTGDEAEEGSQEDQGDEAGNEDQEQARAGDEGKPVTEEVVVEAMKAGGR